MGFVEVVTLQMLLKKLRTHGERSRVCTEHIVDLGACRVYVAHKEFGWTLNVREHICLYVAHPFDLGIFARTGQRALRPCAGHAGGKSQRGADANVERILRKLAQSLEENLVGALVVRRAHMIEHVKEEQSLLGNIIIEDDKASAPTARTREFDPAVSLQVFHDTIMP